MKFHCSICAFLIRLLNVSTFYILITDPEIQLPNKPPLKWRQNVEIKIFLD